MTALAVAVFLALALYASWVCDDAFIAFRYSRNFAHGLGLRFNLGVDPPVEGYTQLGWVLWMSVFELLDLDPRLWSRATGIAAGAVLVVWLTRLARRRLRLDATGTAAAALFCATAPTVAVWATGGLETMAFALAVFATAERLVGDPDRPRGAQAAIAAVLAAVLRTDGVWWLGMIVAAALVHALRTRRPALLRHALGCALAVGVTVGLHTLWRLGYYGDWLPNTARAKVGLSWQSLHRGIDYVLSYWLAIPATLVVLVLAAPLAWRGRDPCLRLCVVIALGTFAYGALTGGDFMAMGRFFLPAIPFLALAAGRLVHGLDQVKGRAAGIAAAALLVALSVPALFGVDLSPRSWREAVTFRWGKEYETEYQFWRSMIWRAEQWTHLGRALALHTRPGESLVRGAIGAVGYYSGLFIHDQLGLVSRDVVREIEVDPDELQIPGHDRFANQAFFARFRPTYVDATIAWVGRAAAARGEVPPHVAQLARTRPGAEVFPFAASQGFPHDGYLIVWRY